jgi:transcriptional regulator GlxA family with amidase domain
VESGPQPALDGRRKVRPQRPAGLDVLAAGPLDLGADEPFGYPRTVVLGMPTDCRRKGTSPGRSARRPDPSPLEAPPQNEHPAVTRVRAYLESQYATRVRLETLAEISGVTMFHLVRVFRAATGVPPHAYLEQVRVERAATLLREGLPISSVAFRTGFSDQSHLTRFFKRHLGIPPGQYQRAVRRATERV